MPRGRPKKKQRNTSGLRNHKTSSLAPEASSTTHGGQLPVISDALPTPSWSQSDLELDSELGGYEDTGTLRLAGVAVDSLKISFEQEYHEDTDKSDIDEEIECGALNDQEFSCKLVEMIQSSKEDDGDPDWIPEQLRRKVLRRAAECSARPSKYKKGPDVMSKSERTRQRYKAQWKGQSVLDKYGFKKDPPLHPTQAAPSESSVPSSKSEIISRTRTSSVLSSEPDSTSNSPGSEPEKASPAMDAVSTMNDGLVEEEGAEEWEEELDVANKGGSEIRDWKILRDAQAETAPSSLAAGYDGY